MTNREKEKLIEKWVKERYPLMLKYIDEINKVPVSNPICITYSQNLKGPII